MYVPFELEQVELGILIPVISLPEKSQKECSLSMDRVNPSDALSKANGLLWWRCLYLL